MHCLSILNIRHHESFPVKTSLGVICKNLAHWIFSYLKYIYGVTLSPCVWHACDVCAVVCVQCYVEDLQEFVIMNSYNYSMEYYKLLISEFSH